MVDLKLNRFSRLKAGVAQVMLAVAMIMTLVVPAGAQTTPGVPGAPVVTLTPFPTYVQVSWVTEVDGGAPIFGFVLRHRQSGTQDWTTVSFSYRESINVGYLTQGLDYDFQVRATNEVGEGPWSTLKTVTVGPRPPGTPTLWLTPGNKQIEVGWSHPDDNGGSVITEYQIHYREAGSSDSTIAYVYCEVNDPEDPPQPNCPPPTTKTLALTNGQEYQFKIRAKNAGGEGALSVSWLNGTPAATAVAPSLPRDPMVTPGDEQILVEWVRPGNDGGNPTLNYQVRFKEVGGSWATDTITGHAESYTITSLTNGTTYEVEVQAFGGPVSGWTNTLRATPNIIPTSGRLVHDLPIEDNGDVATVAIDEGSMSTYTLRLAEQPSAPVWVTVTSSHPDSVEVVNSPLVFSRSNYMTPQTVSFDAILDANTVDEQVTLSHTAESGGYGDESFTVPVSVTDTATVPGAPGMPNLTPGDQQIDVSWTAPSSDGGQAITDYQVEYKLTSESEFQDAGYDRGTETMFTIGGLMNGESYQVRVRAMNSLGYGDWSPVASTAAASAPGKPVVSLTSGNTTITATWPAPANNGADISDYDVQYRASGASGWTTLTHDGTGRTARITGLNTGTTYEVQVRATNSAGIGEWSDVVSIRTNTPAPVSTGTRPVSPPPLRDYFTDDEGSVHENNINLIARQGITVGCDPATPTLYCPDGEVTRAQMAAFLVRAMGSTPFLTGTGGFSDVANDAWYAGFVARLARLGVAAGFGDGTFRPDDPVTRAQMATFLSTALNLAS